MASLGGILLQHGILAIHRITLFKLVYGRDPPHLKSYNLGDATIQLVDDLLTELDNFLEQTKAHLQWS